MIKAKSMMKFILETESDVKAVEGAMYTIERILDAASSVDYSNITAMIDSLEETHAYLQALLDGTIW